MKDLANTHDLRLPDWGPYSKQYFGISHVANAEMGLRFDLSVFPSFYRRKIELPLAMAEANYHIWNASADLSYFETRHELEWKDKVYSDISYAKASENCYFICADCVNNTDAMQNIALHYMASIHYPSVNAKYNEEWIAPVSYQLPENASLWYAIDHQNYCRAQVHPTDSLMPDGLRRGEVRANGFHRGSGVALEGAEDTLTFSVCPKATYHAPALTLRAQNNSDDAITLSVSGDICATFTLPAHAAPQTFSAPTQVAQHQNLTFQVSANSGGAILDSLVLCEEKQLDEIQITSLGLAYTPTTWENGNETPYLSEDNKIELIEKAQTEDSFFVLKYRDSDIYYGICWDFADYDIRYLYSDNLESYIKVMAHDHVNKILQDANSQRHYSNVFFRPIAIPPHSHRTHYGAICCGQSKDEVTETMRNLLQNTAQIPAQLQAQRTKICSTTNVEVDNTPDNATDGATNNITNRISDIKSATGTISAPQSPYQQSQDIMMATTLTNVVYPIYAKGKYIKHNTPGRWWDTLYTWDSGFCGLGLMACDTNRAIDCLNAYVTEPNDLECAFIHHGTPLPIQFYLCKELYQRNPSTEFLAHFYPRLHQYYLFLCGKLGSSDIARLPSGLLNTWSYFYNSAGWDDYPPQVYTHKQGLADTIACVSNTAHVIRCAKILTQFASLLNTTNDNVTDDADYNANIAEYTQDIARLSDALQTNAWDAQSGYFSYVLHEASNTDSNSDAAPRTKILRHKSGENYNMGLDGTAPLLAGIVTDAQRDIIHQHLMSPKHLLTEIGLSTVDQSAAYYKKDGYWNGSVWMPHQWFYYKALLDYGYPEDAYHIAEIALQTWQNEVSQSYNCFEHFIIDSGRGAGWHHFSGLSTPVLLWHESYYKAGTITSGFDGLITARNQSDDTLSFTVCYSDAHQNTSLVVVMPAAKRYTITVDGTPATFTLRNKNVLEITLKSEANTPITICCQGGLNDINIV